MISIESHFKTYPTDEQRLLDIGLILHYLREALNTETGDSKTTIMYCYTSDTGQSARFGLLDRSCDCFTIKLISLRVDLITHCCRLIDGAKIYKKCNTLDEFVEYYRKNRKILYELIGK